MCCSRLMLLCPTATATAPLCRQPRLPAAHGACGRVEAVRLAGRSAVQPGGLAWTLPQYQGRSMWHLLDCWQSIAPARMHIPRSFQNITICPASLPTCLCRTAPTPAGTRGQTAAGVAAQRGPARRCAGGACRALSAAAPVSRPISQVSTAAVSALPLRLPLRLPAPHLKCCTA